MNVDFLCLLSLSGLSFSHLHFDMQLNRNIGFSAQCHCTRKVVKFAETQQPAGDKDNEKQAQTQQHSIFEGP